LLSFQNSLFYSQFVAAQVSQREKSSDLGQEATWRDNQSMSALPLGANIHTRPHPTPSGFTSAMIGAIMGSDARADPPH
jgi:hypothetical protein